MRLDALDQFFACIDIDAGCAVSDGCSISHSDPSGKIRANPATRPAVVFYIRELKDLRDYIMARNYRDRLRLDFASWAVSVLRAPRRCALAETSAALTRVELYQATAPVDRAIRGGAASGLRGSAPDRAGQGDRPPHGRSGSRAGAAHRQRPPLCAAVPPGARQSALGVLRRRRHSTAGSLRTISPSGDASVPPPFVWLAVQTGPQTGTVITADDTLADQVRDQCGRGAARDPRALADRRGSFEKSLRLSPPWRQPRRDARRSRASIRGRGHAHRPRGNPSGRRRSALDLSVPGSQQRVLRGAGGSVNRAADTYAGSMRSPARSRPARHRGDRNPRSQGLCLAQSLPRIARLRSRMWASMP